MDEGERKNIGRLIEESVSAIRKGDTFRLKELSNGNTHNASIFQDGDSLTIAIVIYALSKVVDRSSIKKAAVISDLQKSLGFLSSGNLEAYRSALQNLVRRISKADFRLKKFVSSVIEQANIRKGFALCEHGLSIGRVANLLGISKWELMDYMGQTRISEQSFEVIPTEKRLSIARGIFAK